MENVSAHTLQLNVWIALCQIDKTISDTLRRLGYTVDIIDPKFVHEGNEVNPDIILTSRGQNHSIVIDCKSKTLKEHQNERYEAIHEKPDVLITRGIVSSAGARESFDAEFAYSSFSDLSKNPLLPENDFAVIHFDEDAEQFTIETLEGYEFNLEELQDEFPILTGTRRLPTDYFPFDVGTGENDHKQFILSILQSTVHLALKQDEFTVDDILEDAQPLWVDIDTDLKNEMRSRTETIIGQYQQRGLDEHIEKVQASSTSEWKVVSKSLQALQRKVDRFVEEVQGDLEQADITDYIEE